MNYCNCPNCQTVNCPAATADEAQAQALVRSSELVGTLLETIDELRRLIWEHHSDDVLKAGIVVCPACTSEEADKVLNKAALLLVRPNIRISDDANT